MAEGGEAWGGCGGASHGGVTKKRGHTQTISEAICSQETFFKLGREILVWQGHWGREDKRQERRRAGCMQIVFSFFFAQVEENVKETLSDDDDARVCCSGAQREARWQLSATGREIIHILRQQTDFSFVKNKKQRGPDSCSQTNRINSFYLRDQKPPPLAEIHVNYKPSLSQHSCQCQINVRPLRSLRPPLPNNTTSIDS